jgi:hypothetical protein
VIEVLRSPRHILHVQQQLPPIEIRLNGIGSYFNRAVEICERPIQVTLRLSDNNAIKEGGGIGRGEMKGASIVRHGPGQITLALFGVATVVVQRLPDIPAIIPDFLQARVERNSSAIIS